jgi:integrase
VGHRLKTAAPASVNQELAIIKRAFKLAMRAKRLWTMPHIPMLTLHNTRTGFFERADFDAVRAALPAELRGVVTLTYLTGWRIPSEVLPLQWSSVDRTRQTLRLESGITKNAQGRTLPYGLLPELVAVIDAAWQTHTTLAAAGTLCPCVFHRSGQPIKVVRRAWAKACEAAGCVGKIAHDFRRTAVRNLVRAGCLRRSRGASPDIRRAASSTATTSSTKRTCAPLSARWRLRRVRPTRREPARCDGSPTER